MAAATTAVDVTSNCDRIKEIKEFDQSKVGVKGLKDSGIASIPKFFIQPPEVLFSQTNTSANNNINIPVIDLQNINSPTRRPKVVEQIKEAAKEWGFFQVINHGIPISVLEETIRAVKSFHEQPEEAKAKHYSREEISGAVIYSSNYDLYRAKAATWHDYFKLWMSPEERAIKAEEIPETVRKEVVSWDICAKKVGEDVMELLCEGIGLECSRFKELGCSEERLLAGVYYPNCPQPDLTLGLHPHTDPGTLTILIQNHVSGLQIKHGQEWVDVKPLPGAMLINVADSLQIISNGEYKSIQHQVRANSSQDARISVAEFLNLSKWEEHGSFGPLPELVSAEKPARYRHITKDELLSYYNGKERDSKSLVERLKL